MTKMMNKAMMLLFVCLLSAPAAFASGWWGGNNNDNCNDVPLDGGISLLAAAGVGYGMKKVAAKRKKNQEENQK